MIKVAHKKGINLSVSHDQDYSLMFTYQTTIIWHFTAHWATFSNSRYVRKEKFDGVCLRMRMEL